MELNTNFDQRAAMRRASVNGLAVVGFVALVFFGIYIAVSAARFVPDAVTRLASASVYFSSIFSGNDTNELEVVPNGNDTPATSLPIGGASTTASTPATTGTPAATPTAGTKSYSSAPLGGVNNSTYSGPLTGKSDLRVRLIAVGYLDKGGDVDSFVTSTKVPKGKNGAIRFSVENEGTNVSGSWDFDATLPTSPKKTYTSPTQQSLAPGEHIDFTLGFDRAKTGSQDITITVDADNDVKESNEGNNDATGTVTINN